jgi:DnaJ-like protein
VILSSFRKCCFFDFRALGKVLFGKLPPERSDCCGFERVECGLVRTANHCWISRMRKDHYLTLHVKSDATTEEVKAAYRRLALEVSPDLSGSGSDPFLEIQEAYSVLSDPRQRALYDEEGEQVPVSHSHIGRSKAERFGQQAWDQPLRPVQPMPRTVSIFGIV